MWVGGSCSQAWLAGWQSALRQESLAAGLAEGHVAQAEAAGASVMGWLKVARQLGEKSVHGRAQATEDYERRTESRQDGVEVWRSSHGEVRVAGGLVAK